MTGPRRLLLCAPSDDIAGGIPAVVLGLTAGFAQRDDLVVRRLTYGKFNRTDSKPFRLLREVLRLFVCAWACVVFRPDVVQLETSFDRKTLVRDTMFAGVSRLLGRRVLVHVHGGAFHYMAEWPGVWRRWARWFLLNHCIVVTSRAELRELETMFDGRGRFSRIDNPVAMGQVVPAPLGADSVHVVFASRFVNAKGVLETIDAMQWVRAPNVILHVFGGGELEGAVETRSAAGRAAGRILLHGEVALPSLLSFYAGADVFVFPSTHHEGFPMALFFAAGSGMAIIASRVRPLPDFFDSPANCLWVDDCTPQAIAARIDELAASPTLRAVQRANNRRLIEQFAPERIGAQFVAFYDSLINEEAATCAA